MKVKTTIELTREDVLDIVSSYLKSSYNIEIGECSVAYRFNGDSKLFNGFNITTKSQSCPKCKGELYIDDEHEYCTNKKCDYVSLME